MNAVIYARYSNGPNQTEQSIEGQIRDCMEFAKKNDITVIDTYIDRSISGTDFEHRSEFNRLMHDCERKQFTAVIVWKIDRFGRNREELAMNKVKLKKHGVKLMYAKEHIPDGPEGIILESLLEGMAEYYSAELSQKVRRGLRESMLKGHVLGGNKLTGYNIVNKKYVIDPVGAAAVKEIFERYSNGEVARVIAEDLNKRGYRTARGTDFTDKSIYQMLRNEKYAGIYRYGEIVVNGVIEPIIALPLFEKVQEILKMNCRNRSKNKTTAPVEYLLTGKIFCGHCNNTIIGDSGTSRFGNTYYYYKCATKKHRKKGVSCSQKNYRKEFLESVVMQVTISDVLQPDLIDCLAKKVVEIQSLDDSNLLLESLKKQMKEAEKALANLMRAIEMGIITETTRDRMIELENRKSELKTEMAIAEIKKPALTEEQVKYWLYCFKNGDIEDPAFQIKLINTFIHAIYLQDASLTIVYNYCNPEDNSRGQLNFDIENTKKMEPCVRMIPFKQSRFECSRTLEVYPTCFVLYISDINSFSTHA